MKTFRFGWGACLAVVAITLIVLGVVTWWRAGNGVYLLALSGDPARQYEYGRWLNRHHREQEALMWMENAADGHDARAMLWLGLASQNSEYFSYPNAKAAFTYFSDAANRRNVPAMVMLASMYEGAKYVRDQKGMTSEMANKAALVWYMRAADGGVGLAIDRMVEVYEKGELGMEKSQKEADSWRRTPRKSEEYWVNQIN